MESPLISDQIKDRATPSSAPTDLENALSSDKKENFLPAPEVEDQDPFELIQRDQYINDSNSALRNLIGWIDYHDKLYSRKFSLIDNVYANWIIGFFAWIFNRKQALLQFPVLAIWTMI